MPLADGESLDAAARAARARVLRSGLDPIVTNKTPGDGPRHPRVERQQPLRRRRDGATWTAFDERYPLNSRLVKTATALVEEVYRVGGRYDREIAASSRTWRPRSPFAPTPMAAALRALVRFYRSGEDADRGAYDIAWVRDTESPVDTINGFIEVYMDARGVKGAWEALVYYVNPRRRGASSASPRTRSGSRIRCRGRRSIASREVTGVIGRAIEVVIETGDSGPMTPIGINLPNDQEIREQLRQQVGVALERDRGLREAPRRRAADRVLLGPGRSRRAERWGALRAS